MRRPRPRAASHPRLASPPLPPCVVVAQGVASLCLSWVFSPLLGGLLAAFLFFFLRLLVLRSPNSYKRAFYVLPIFVFLTFFM